MTATAVPDAALLPFVKAIAARPQDPLPKLILADFLDEHGDDAASVMRWAGTVNKYPQNYKPSRRYKWQAWKYPSQIEDAAGDFITRSLMRRMFQSPPEWFIRGRSSASVGYGSTRVAFLKLIAAARKCAADGVDPFGED